MVDSPPLKEQDDDERPLLTQKPKTSWGIIRGCLLIIAAVALHKFAKDLRATVKQEIKKEWAGSYIRAGTIVSLFDTGNMLLRWLLAPLLAGISDHIGRRPILLYVTFVEIIPDVCLAIKADYYYYLSIDALPTTTGVIYAYIADMTPHASPTLRTFIFGMLEAAKPLGSVLGYLLNILFVKYAKWAGSTICWISVCLSTLGVCCILFAPESLALKNRTERVNLKEANPLGAVRKLGKYWKVLGAYFTAYMLMQFSYLGVDEIQDDYLATFYNVTGTKFNVFNTYSAVVSVLCQTIVAIAVVRWLKGPKTVVIGITLVTGSYILFLMVNTLPLIYISTAVNGLGQIWRPALSEIVTGCVSESEQGAVQGALQSVTALATFGAPTIFQRSLYATYKHFRGIAFLEASIFSGLALLAIFVHVLTKTIRTKWRRRQQQREQQCTSGTIQDIGDNQLQQDEEEDCEDVEGSVAGLTVDSPSNKLGQCWVNKIGFPCDGWFVFLVLLVVGNLLAGIALIFIFPLKEDSD